MKPTTRTGDAEKKEKKGGQRKREREQRMEQMRALDNKISIHTVVTDCKGRGVDTAEDIKRLEIHYAS